MKQPDYDVVYTVTAFIEADARTVPLRTWRTLEQAQADRRRLEEKLSHRQRELLGILRFGIEDHAVFDGDI